MQACIQVRGLGVRFLFDRSNRPVTPVQARLRGGGTETWGLRDVTFGVSPGESVALIGPSGAGKTTLLRALAGVYVPDAGSVQVRGKVASLLSVQGGLMHALSGRENALLLGVLWGLRLAEARAALEGIKERSRLGPAFERPVASFSQGMLARLALVVAEEIRPDVLLIDEIQALLDHEFRAYLEERARGVLGAGGIVVVTGHDHAMLARLCDRALLLADGRLQADGGFAEVRGAYLARFVGPAEPTGDRAGFA